MWIYVEHSCLLYVALDAQLNNKILISVRISYVGIGPM